MNQQGLESFKAPTPSWYALTQHKGAIPGWKAALLQGSSKGVKPEWKGKDPIVGLLTGYFYKGFIL